MAETQTHLRDYLALPKAIGEVSSSELLELADYYIELYDTSSSDRLRSEYAKIIASTLCEAAITIDDPEHSVDDPRLEMIDIAEEYYGITAKYEEDLLERGYSNPNDQVAWLRAQTLLLFTDVYRDMICGEITSYTQQELLTSLKKVIAYIQKETAQISMKPKHRADLTGLSAELNAIHATWQEYKIAGNPIAIPSTYRGGDGHKKEDQTHDLVIFQQNEDTTFSPTKRIEVKRGIRGSSKRLHTLARYTTSTLLIVSRNGTAREVA